MQTFDDYTKDLPDGVPCKHPGCLHHVSHPCEGCGRVAGRRLTPHAPDAAVAADKPGDTAPETESIKPAGSQPRR